MPKKDEAKAHLERFKALTRQLIAAPKAEVEAREKAFREKVQKRKSK